MGNGQRSGASRLEPGVSCVSRFPRLALAVAFASWWWWIWVPFSGVFHVHEPLWSTLVPAVLVAFGAFVTSVAGREHRWLTLAALIASPAVVVPVGIGGAAMRSFVAGEAELMVSGMPEVFLPYGSIDPETRIPVRGWGCMGPPRWAPIHNATLRLLDTLAGPMPDSYQGPLPSEDAVTAALRNTGVSTAPPRPAGDATETERVAFLDHDLIVVEHCRHRPAGARCTFRIVHGRTGRSLGRPRRSDEALQPIR